MSEQRPNVVVLGGGYGGIRVAKPLDAVADVTLVDPTDAFLHNVAAWRALVAPEWIERIFFPYDRLLARGRFVQDRAVAVAGHRVTLGSGDVLEPDYLVLATGSAYPFPAKTAAPDLTEAQTALRAAHAALAGSDRVLIVGAGPAGLELAGEIRAAFPAKHVTVADRGADILPGPYDPALRAELRRQLDALGVELVLGSPLRRCPACRRLSAATSTSPRRSGAELRADIWFRAFGTAPDTGYLRGTLADAVGPDGRVRVDEHLRVAGHDRVFAIGDLAAADRPMAGMAGAQADLLAANLAALITATAQRDALRGLAAGHRPPARPGGRRGAAPGRRRHRRPGDDRRRSRAATCSSTASTRCSTWRYRSADRRRARSSAWRTRAPQRGEHVVRGRPGPVCANTWMHPGAAQTPKAGAPCSAVCTARPTRLEAANQPAQVSSPGRSACRCQAAPGSATSRSGAVWRASAALRRATVAASSGAAKIA